MMGRIILNYRGISYIYTSQQNASAFFKTRECFMDDTNLHLLDAQELGDWILRYLLFSLILGILYRAEGSHCVHS